MLDVGNPQIRQDPSVAWDDDITNPWRVGDELPPHNDHCMVCGVGSPTSPIVERFRVTGADGAAVVARVRFDSRHQGAPFYAHGGMVAAVLDDAAGYVSFLVQRMFVTAHLEVDYRRPVLLDETYEVRAWCTGIDGRKVHLAADMRTGPGDEVVAEARGLFVTVDVEHFRP